MYIEICTNLEVISYCDEFFNEEGQGAWPIIIDDVRYSLETFGWYGHVMISGDVPISQCSKLIYTIEEVTGRSVRVVDDDHCE